MKETPYTHIPHQKEMLDFGQHLTALEEENLRLRQRVQELEQALSEARKQNQHPELLTSVREVTPVRDHTQAALNRRDAILTAVAIAAETFLGETSLNDGMQVVLAALGQATHVSRVYVFANELNDSGTICISQQYEWAAEGVIPQINNPDLQHLPYVESGLQRWAEDLPQGLPIYGIIRNFPPDEQEILVPQEILALAVIPIFVGAEWWGFIGFDECLEERDWNTSEIEGLRAAAGIIGAAMHRDRAEHALRVSEQRFRDVLDAAGEYIWEIDTQGCYTFVSSRVENVLGYTPAEMIGRPFFNFMPADTAQQATAWFADHVSRPAPFRDLHYHSLHRNGRLVTQQISGIPIFHQGNLVGYRGAGLDMTEQVAIQAEREQMQAQLIKAQQDALRELSTPLIPLAEHVVTMPLIGAIDTVRAQQILERLLEGVAQHRAQVVILDITGVQVVDAQVAYALIQAAQAVKLLGAQIILTGIHPQMARTLVNLGVDLHGIITQSTLQSGIAIALQPREGQRFQRVPGYRKAS